LIRISSESNNPIRLLNGDGGYKVRFHKRYGFASDASYKSREKLRLASGTFAPEDKEEFSFKVERTGDRLKLVAVEGCEVEAVDSLKWRIRSEFGLYFVDEVAVQDRAPIQLAPEKGSNAYTKIFVALVLLAVLPFFIREWSNQKEIETAQKTEEIAPVVLRPEKPVPPPRVEPPVQTAIDPKMKMRKAVSQQLGFLGVLGKKDLKKVMGGLPTEAKQVTAGAGPGGDAGSGGEMLAGMGRGLHKTTVGNSGVAGLGGIGTHGAGGGEGGYGDTAFGGAGGKSLSLPLSREAVMEEGLDRNQIQATIMRYLSQVRACYEEGLNRNPALIGQVTMGFEVGGAGQVNYSNVQRSSLGDKPVESCIATKMLGWKFPQPRGGKSVKVSYPFMLRPIRS
jgi:hypothetical protein